MKVNIVYSDYNKDNVLARLAKTLADRNGWMLSRMPIQNVDLNYYQVYVEWAQSFTDWRRTPTAAYFSHYEPETPFKALFWRNAAQGIDIPVCTARMYGKMLKRPYAYAHAPVPECMKIEERAANLKPIIGFAGTVYKSGRKGFPLAQSLVKSLDNQAAFVGIGAGWPCRNVPDDISGLPGLYNSLDLYVCTSLTEGVPMPPLFSLACGVPVVIPHGVGLCDELPEMIGLYHYERGDQADLEAKTRQALADIGDKLIDREALRAVVSKYNPEQWAKDHVSGLRRLMNADRREAVQAGNVEELKLSSPAEVKSGGKSDRGVYYVAYGAPSRNCAQGAMQSFKRHMPGVPVALVSDKPLGPEDIFIENADEDIGGRSAKTKIFELAPQSWKYVLYLDADTEVIADISLYYKMLEDGYDFVICKNPQRYHVASAMIRPDNNTEVNYTLGITGTDEIFQLNGGAFSFSRNLKTARFITGWHEEWLRYGARDQGALLRALWQWPVRFFVLGNEWNTVTRYDAPETSAGLLHYPMTARRWRGVLHGRLNDAEAWKAVKDFEGK